MNIKLSEYNEKRDFKKTPEPRANEVKASRGKSSELQASDNNSSEQLRFVVQHHLARNDHYDFRLEWNGVLLSWAVPKGPSYSTQEKRLAVKVEDHPIDYRNFEGTIPKGEYGGGVVMLWDEGFWEPFGNVDQGIDDGLLKFAISGVRLKGNWALIRLKAKRGDSKNNWLLLKEKDQYAKTESGISRYETSIRTGRTMAEIEGGKGENFNKNPFNNAKVQLAKMVKEIPDGDDWLYEMKYDGYRILAFVEGNSAKLITRNGNDYTNRFYSVANSLIDLSAGRAMVLDGEMTIIDKSGKTDFQALQNYIKRPKGQNLTYIVFDLISIDGEDIRNKPLFERKEILEALIKDSPENLYYSRHIKGNGKESFNVACEASMEGIIGKKYNSVYSGTRNGDWIKLKCDKRQEFVIGGYTLSNKKVSGISSVLLGVYENGEFIYVGRAGTGFNKHNTKQLTEKFSKFIRQTTPYKNAPKTRPNEKTTWLEPELIAEIKFTEWTEENQLRHASFKGLREDKSPRDVKRELNTLEEVDLVKEGNNYSHYDVEQDNSFKEEHDNTSDKKVENNKNIIVSGVKITSPNKVIYNDPEITKIDVIRYYEKVSEYMLPYVEKRILSIVCCPKGVSENCFYKKHPGSKLKGIAILPINADDEEAEDYFYIENKSGIISEAQMGTLEFHTWGSRVDELEKPNMMVFDLDPDEKMDISRVRQGVNDVKSILTELSLKSYLKTSGGKGYHVVVPLKPTVSWDVFHNFARGVAQVMEDKWPDRYTSNIRKSKRKDKIFIDWIRNARGATSIAPYSLRARKGGKVSMPIPWNELDFVAPDGINMSDAILKIQGIDPWEDFFNNDQMLR